MAERRAELAERSREDQELAARVEAEVARRLAEAAQSEEVAARIQRKLIVRTGSNSTLRQLVATPWLALTSLFPHVGVTGVHREVLHSPSVEAENTVRFSL